LNEKRREKSRLSSIKNSVCFVIARLKLPRILWCFSRDPFLEAGNTHKIRLAMPRPMGVSVQNLNFYTVGLWGSPHQRGQNQTVTQITHQSESKKSIILIFLIPSKSVIGVLSIESTTFS